MRTGYQQAHDTDKQSSALPTDFVQLFTPWNADLEAAGRYVFFTLSNERCFRLAPEQSSALLSDLSQLAYPL
jgi:hypothetical protein